MCKTRWIFRVELVECNRGANRSVFQQAIEAEPTPADRAELRHFFESFLSALYVQDDSYSQRHDRRKDFVDEYLPGGRHVGSTRAKGIARHAYDAADTAHKDPIFFISEKQTFDGWFAPANRDTTLTWTSLKAEVMDAVPSADHERRRMYESTASPNYRAARKIEPTRGVRVSLSAIKAMLEGPDV